MPSLPRLPGAACVLSASLAFTPALDAQTPAPEKKAPAVTRISFWTVKPGKGAEARAFWKQFAPVFEDMKAKGLLLEYQFLEPALHTGQDWHLAYLWVCRDIATYGRADQHFGEAISKMDSRKIGADFEAAFDGSKHRDELWRTVEIR